MTDLAAGTVVKANDTPPTVNDTQPDAFTCTATTFGVTTTGGTYNDCGVPFTAPTTGRVVILFNSQQSNTSASTVVSPVVRAGGTVGSGAVHTAASDDECTVAQGSNERRAGAHRFVDGLTPGDTYNVRLEHRVSSGTGTIRRRGVTVLPAT